MTEWVSLVSAAGVVIALISNLFALRDRDSKKAGEMAEFRADIKHIREQVDKSGGTMDEIGAKLENVDKRLVAAEQNIKSAHHRIDALR